VKQLESASGAMLVQNRRSGSRLRMEIAEALLDASPGPRILSSGSSAMTIATSGPPFGAGSNVKELTVPGGTHASVDARPARDRVGNHSGGGLTLQSGCPAGSVFQNMIWSK
jgi:hypothetical protein